ncbi:MAG: hypothetical protein KDC35_04050 [Acidobacteria bacterium]|nr:hypothetical protein [Acidobacteriota bacterium]
MLNDHPDAAGFNRAGSDAKAVNLAEATMKAMGGYEAWDQTRFLRWNFFGRRAHVWDKWTGRIRVETDDVVILMNVHNREGKAFKGGQPLEGAELEAALVQGYEMWINDAYWLVMPYKLKDSGVTLKYVGEQTMEDGRTADVIQMTFEDVGVTPENKYHVWIAQDSGLVEAWSFFETAQAEEPRFMTPWANWKKMGAILLSDDRGKYKHTDVAVYAALPDSVFESPAAVDWSTLVAE